jgi:hypothetical protein
VAHPQIAVFARLANGNAQTVRRIEGQAAKLSRTMHSIAFDAVHDELVVTNPFAQAVLTFKGDANGEVAPIRVIQGPKTGLGQPDVMSVDPVNNEYYVPIGVGGGNAGNKIHVFSRTADGDVAPIRVLNTGGGPPSVDYEHNVILITGQQGIHIYARTASGDDKPLRIVTGGPKSGVEPPNEDVIWIPGTRNFMARTRPFGIRTEGDRPGVPGNYQTTEEAATFFGVWSIDDDGDVPPRYTIGHDTFMEFRNFALNGKNKEVMMSDKTRNSIFTYSFPEAWETFTPLTAAPYVRPGGRGGGGFGGGGGGN